MDEHTHARRLSDAGRAELKGWEGDAKKRGAPMLRAYDDGVGIWTIGWGHTRTVKPGQVITTERAEQLLDQDLGGFEAAVSQLATAPSQMQYDAMVLLAFNIGIAAFTRSTVLRAHNRGDYDAAARAFAMWNRAGGRVLRGLIKRRAAEAALYLKGSRMFERSLIERDVLIDDTQPTPDTQDVDASLTQSRTVQGGAVVTTATVVGAMGTASQIARDASDTYTSVTAFGIPVMWLAAAAAIAALCGVGYMLWARYDDKRRGFK